MREGVQLMGAREDEEGPLRWGLVSRGVVKAKLGKRILGARCCAGPSWLLLKLQLWSYFSSYLTPREVFYH